MAPTALVATAGAANANAYVTSEVADQYHADRPTVGTTWAVATSDQKIAAILWATKLLDRYFVWQGSVVDSTQKLLWPRAGLLEVNGWNALNRTEIPEQIQWATAEFARQLLVADRTGDSEISTQKITSIKAGSVALTFGAGVMAKPIPDVVAHLIPSEWGYLRSSQQRRIQRA